MSRIYDDIAAEIQAVNQEISKTQGDHAALISKLGQLERERYESLRKNVPQNHVTYLSIRDGQRAAELRIAIAHLDRKLEEMPNLDPRRTHVMKGDRDRYAAELARLEPAPVKPFVPFDVEVAERNPKSYGGYATSLPPKDFGFSNDEEAWAVEPTEPESIEANEPPPADSGLIPPVESQAPDPTPVEDDSIPF